MTKIKETVEARVSFPSEAKEPTLSKEAVEKAVKQYVGYKNGFCGLRWFRTSTESTHTRTVLLSEKDDHNRYKCAEEYLIKNTGRAFANALQQAMNP